MSAGDDRRLAAIAPGSPLSGRRVLIVLESLELGGAERQALILGGELVRREGARVEVWGLGAEGRGAVLCMEAGIAYRSLHVAPPRGRIRLLSAIGSFARRLRSARPDVILPYTLVPNVLCCAASPAAGARLCIWNQRDAGTGRLGARIERFAVRRAGIVVANSRPAADFLHGTLGVDRARIRIVPNGVEAVFPAAEPRQGRERLGVGADAFLVSMVANLHANKDHATLLRAFRIVLDRWPLADRRPILLLAGRLGETYGGLSSLAQELALGESVRFLGPVDDVAGLFSASDLAALSSVQEGCPNGVLEAMAAGLVVVGTDIPGIRDAVGSRGLHRLAPAGDPSAMAGRILEAARDPAMRRNDGEANRLRAEREFSIRRMCDAMAGLIAEGLS